MTPLYLKLLKRIADGEEVLMPDGDPLLDHLGGAVCFEITDVWSLVKEIGDKFLELGSVSETCFLPAPVTWIEYLHKMPMQTEGMDVKIRRGFLLDIQEFPFIRAVVVSDHVYVLQGKTTTDFDIQYQTYDLSVYLGEGISPEQRREEEFRRDAFEDEAGVNPTSSQLVAILALINTPNIIGRTLHDPHKGFARQYSTQSKITSVFPLQAWTKINLSVSDPSRADGDGGRSTHFVGEKAFHFVRSHLRVRLGRLEMVRAHNRGNLALGVKRNRYEVKK